ncbi:MAG: hypothetical protein V4538_00855 [Bacteroidota bacterium]
MKIPQNLFLLLTTQEKFKNPYIVIIYKLIELAATKNVAINSLHLKNIYQKYYEIITILETAQIIKTERNIGPREILVNKKGIETKQYETINTYLSPNKYTVVNKSDVQIELTFEYNFYLKNINDNSTKPVNINNFNFAFYPEKPTTILQVEKSHKYFNLGVDNNLKSIAKQSQINKVIELKNLGLKLKEIAKQLNISEITVKRYNKEIKNNSIKTISPKKIKVTKADLFKVENTMEVDNENDLLNVDYKALKYEKDIELRKNKTNSLNKAKTVDIASYIVKNNNSDNNNLKEINERFEQQKEQQLKQKELFDEITNNRIQKEKESIDSITVNLNIELIKDNDFDDELPEGISEEDYLNAWK